MILCVTNIAVIGAMMGVGKLFSRFKSLPVHCSTNVINFGDRYETMRLRGLSPRLATGFFGANNVMRLAVLALSTIETNLIAFGDD